LREIADRLIARKTDRRSNAKASHDFDAEFECGRIAPPAVIDNERNSHALKRLRDLSLSPCLRIANGTR